MTSATKTLAVLAMVAACSSVASARAGMMSMQSTSCNGRVIFDTVYQTETKTKGTYDYYFQLRNTRNVPVEVSVRIGGFGPGITVFSPALGPITLGKDENKIIKFASGTNNQINDGNVSKVYDTTTGTGKFVAAHGCKA